MKILILGSEGFIGSNAVRYFTQKGYDVFKADIVLKDEENYQIINPEHSDFVTLFSDAHFDVALNATGAANVQFSFRYPALDYALNVFNVYLLLDAIRQQDPHCRFINLSSAAVYGNPVKLPISENDALQPLSPYGWHKLYSEQICREFNEYYGLATISLRIFSAYGPGLRKQIFWDIYRKCKSAANSTIQLFGTGNESRDFIFITDLVKAIESVIQKGEFNGNVINVASGIETTIKEAVSLFKSCIDPSLRIEFSGEEKIGDPRNWKADISRLRSLGYEPVTSVETGIRQYIKWITQQ